MLNSFIIPKGTGAFLGEFQNTFAPSTLALLKCSDDFQRGGYLLRNSSFILLIVLCYNSSSCFSCNDSQMVGRLFGGNRLVKTWYFSVFFAVCFLLFALLGL